MPEKQNKTTTKTSVIGMMNKRLSFVPFASLLTLPTNN